MRELMVLVLLTAVIAANLQENAWGGLDGIDEVVERAVDNHQGFAVDQEFADSLTDQGLKKIEQFMLEQAYDPLELPDDHAEFGYTLIVDYDGGIDLFNGHLKDLSTIRRKDSVTVLDRTAKGFYLAYIPAEFNDLKITYNYSASIMGLSPKGLLECAFKNVQLRLSVYYHIYENYVTLIQAEIVNGGQAEMTFAGNALTDWLHDLLVDTVADTLKDRFLRLLKDIVTDALENLFAEVNLTLGS